MENKHTLGPWHTKGRVVCANIPSGTVSSIETPIADVCFSGPQRFSIEEEANLSLISAAPELLESVKGMLESFELVLSEFPDGMAKNSIKGYFIGEYEKAKEAIKKATGAN